MRVWNASVQFVRPEGGRSRQGKKLRWIAAVPFPPAIAVREKCPTSRVFSIALHGSLQFTDRFFQRLFGVLVLQKLTLEHRELRLRLAGFALGHAHLFLAGELDRQRG